MKLITLTQINLISCLHKKKVDKYFYKKGDNFKYTQIFDLEGMIFEVSKVRDSDIFSLEIKTDDILLSCVRTSLSIPSTLYLTTI